ncbi:MAG: nucleotidyl transferase AbiEii/AbiGii toxin family protein [Acidobacteriota bacterium]|jgi:predicted nucleotidyltransferase component of viral defense system|nr:nucleotidyl transferase AbiEii/AbiGii toxin family protein [Acidobacteriota bacterium]
MSVERGGLAQSVQARLVRHAREVGVDPNLVLTRYGVERFLYRLSRSPHAEQFVLKGALLLLAWLGETLRPTRDADLLGYGELSDDALGSIFREVCAVEVEPDAVTFLPDTVEVQAIREDDAYGGRRVTLQARLGPARIGVRVDVGIGDAVVPGPQWLEYPSLLDLPRPRLRAYPREAVVAEKLHAMVLLGMRNSRMKDYFDVHALLREGGMETRRLAGAIASTFARRRTGVPEKLPAGLSDAFSEDAGHQTRWRAFLDRNRLQGPILADLVREIRDGLEPAFEEARRKVRT